MHKKVDSPLSKSPHNKWQTARDIVALIFSKKEIKKRIFIVMSLSIFSTLLKFSLPFFAVYFFPISSQGSSLVVSFNVFIVVLSFCLSYILNQVDPWLRQLIIIPANAQLAKEITGRILRHYFDLPLDRRLSHPVGEIVQHFNITYNATHKVLSALFGFIIPVTIDILVATIFLIFLAGSKSLWLIGIFVIYIISAVIGARKQQLTQKTSIEKIFAIYGNLSPTLSNYENIHYFNKVEYELNKHQQLAMQMQSAMVSDMRAGVWLQLRQGLIATLSLMFMYFLVMWTGQRATSAEISILELFFLVQVLLPLNTFTQGVLDLHTSLFGLMEIMKFLHIEVAMKDTDKSLPLILVENKATIVFYDVSFSYRNSDNEVIPVLDHANFEILPGKKTALVGLSGAGKSTILQLLFRFYDIDDGSIKINGQDIRDLTLNSLRSAIAVVPQTPILLNDSILENLRYVNANADLQSIEGAIEKAGLEAYVQALPAGLNTFVGEGGQKISGGERQRLAIARAILKDAPICIYDEATSSLDIENEKKISDTIDTILPHATTIVITHRLHTIINADQIIVLDNGRVEEVGTYASLIENKQSTFYYMMKTYCESMGILPESITQTNRDLFDRT